LTRVTYREGGVWLHGPKIADWLERLTRSDNTSHNGLSRKRSAALQRRLYEWRRHRYVHYHSIDTYVVRDLYLHPTDIPEWCWVSPNTAKKLDRTLRHGTRLAA
jgi:hypothetical protein